MLVYGDPSFEEELSASVARLHANVAQAVRAPDALTLDALRALLIEAGQWEQAVWDSLDCFPADEAARFGPACQTVTDLLARAFFRCWAAEGMGGHAPSDISILLLGALKTLDELSPLPPARLMVKLPEGYAFYALYPEQYALAAQRWAAEHASEQARRVLVVGVRSIGTSLSALVKAVLDAEGWQAQRVAVRPGGHPYQRRTAFPPLLKLEADWALAVDEGPGQSGSSLASVAQALVEGGLAPSRVCFFPGHDRQPGGAASSSVRAWWARAPRCTVSSDALRWRGLSLMDTLAAQTQALVGSHAPALRVADMGGGLWRQFVYADPSQWPASPVPFERPKYRVVLGDGTMVLWTYAGLAIGPDGPQTSAAFRRLQRRAEAGWTLAPLATALGFVATPWADGQPLSLHEAQDPKVLAHLGRYIASVAGPPLSEEVRAQAAARLAEMLYWNTWEAWGDEIAARTRLWSAQAEVWEEQHLIPTYGDGRLAPHEWVRTPPGALVKTDCGGHDADHTLVGHQSVLWDLAGAVVEWNLGEDAARLLREAYQSAGGVLAPPAVLAFYQMAYCAFRVGLCALSADMLAHDPQEQARLRAAKENYQAQLAGPLE